MRRSEQIFILKTCTSILLKIYSWPGRQRHYQINFWKAAYQDHQKHQVYFPATIQDNNSEPGLYSQRTTRLERNCTKLKSGLPKL